MKNRNFTKKYKDRKTINSNNYAKFEVNWPRGSQFTARHDIAEILLKVALNTRHQINHSESIDMDPQSYLNIVC